MGIVELFIMAVGVSMDAFAVAICKGLATKQVKIKHMALAGIWFGGFQALMPFLGYLIGSTFGEYIEAYDHWVAFLLLGFLGGKMIWEALSGEEEEECCSCSFAPKEMFVMAIATSIDALALGVGFAILPDVNIGAAVGFIGAITFLFSAAGVKLGSVFGAKYKSRAELAGGLILALLGLKIFLEHLGVFEWLGNVIA